MAIVSFIGVRGQNAMPHKKTAKNKLDLWLITNIWL
jgi:hypothetical protein